MQLIRTWPQNLLKTYQLLLCQEQELNFLVKRIPETASKLLVFFEKYGEGFANLRVALRLKLTVELSVASCEKSLSKLKLITRYQKSSMGHDRLSILALLSTESDTLLDMSFDDIIHEFARSKARKLLM